MKHFEDKTFRCNGCLQDIHIRHNEVGGSWHLNGWKDKDGVKIYGRYCSSCFHIMSDEKRQRTCN